MSHNLRNKILNNKNCFLTGATGGLGKCMAMKMAENKCNLFLTSSSTEKLKRLKEQLENTYGKTIKVFYEAGDLNKVEDIKRIIEKTKKSLKSVDILINCAGVFPVKSLQNSDLEDFENCFNINIRAPFLFCKAFSPSMAKNGWGRIVNIGSSSAYSGTKNTSVYCASKHAILGLSRALYNELKERGIRVFCVSPAGVKTEMGRKITWQDYNTLIDPKDVAEYISFIISFDGNMVTDEIRLNRMITQ
jgi:short-subunit dehydrogenase